MTVATDYDYTNCYLIVHLTVNEQTQIHSYVFLHPFDSSWCLPSTCNANRTTRPMSISNIHPANGTPYPLILHQEIGAPLEGNGKCYFFMAVPQAVSCKCKKE